MKEQTEIMGLFPAAFDFEEFDENQHDAAENIIIQQYSAASEDLRYALKIHADDSLSEQLEKDRESFGFFRKYISKELQLLEDVRNNK